MARLFGLIAKHPVDFSVKEEKQSFVYLSTHGCGISWYEPTGKVVVLKQVASTVNPNLNKPIAFKVTSNCILFHVRQATSGGITENNCHPFVYKSDSFAHSGHINKEELFSQLTSPFNEKFTSEPIDSEILFRFIEQQTTQYGDKQGLIAVSQKIKSQTGSRFILTTKDGLYAFQYNKPLYFAFWNKKIIFQITSEETHMVFESKTLSTTTAVLVSSERIGTINWQILDNGELLTVSKDLRYVITKLI
jgi:predicted glutamine amidotransferase